MFSNKIIQGGKVKKFFAVLLSIILIFNANNYIFGNEIEEETDYIWLNEEIKNASATPTEEPILGSRYACAFDRNSKEVIFGKEENKEVPMASTTKIMTAIVLMENLDKNNLSLSTKVKVCKEAAIIQGSRLGLKEHDEITIENLLYGLMLCSRK